MRYVLIVSILMSSMLFAELQKKSYSSGELKSETNYTAGKKDGLATGYHKNGKTKYTVSYKKGKKNGLAKSYYKSGTLRAEENYKDGSLNGLSKQYYKSGKLKSDFIFQDDLPVSGTKYTEDGKKVEG